MENLGGWGLDEMRGYVLTKIKKGKSLDEIADEVEEPVEVVKRIIEEKCYAI